MSECGVILPNGAPILPAGITATSWLLADAETGEVLAAKDPHARHRPASTIKLLTALLVANRLPPDRVVVATQADADQEGSRVGIGPGGHYTVRQLLTGLLLVSGNDAAHALAGQLGGVPATVEQMNQLAAQLGALDTHAATPSGLDGPGMSTSAYDLALVFGHVLGNPLLAGLVRTPQVDFPGFGGRPGFVVSNDNKLLMHYPGALGGKTGFTDDARHTYVGAAVREGRPLIVVLMRGEQHPVPMWEQAARLLDYGFALPQGRPVGQLVAGPPETPTTPAVTPRGGDGADAATQSGSPGPDLPVPGWLWLGLAALVLAALITLVVLQHRRPTP
jgi:D-alanyl-D-alanine carboxypeptidase (penicillin-binding protein 5/6)